MSAADQIPEWSVVDQGSNIHPLIKDGAGWIVAQTATAHARYIVRAVNAHEQLVVALEKLLPHIDSEIEQRKFGGNDEDWAELESLATAAHAAVAKAKGVA